MYHATQNCATEITFTSQRCYADPFNEADVAVYFRHDDGRELPVPAFWAGDNTWKVRFAPPSAGHYTFRRACTHAGDDGLHGVAGELQKEGGRPQGRALLASSDHEGS